MDPRRYHRLLAAYDYAVAVACVVAFVILGSPALLAAALFWVALGVWWSRRARRG